MYFYLKIILFNIKVALSEGSSINCHKTHFTRENTLKVLWKYLKQYIFSTEIND